jgi:hypothetical protein
MHSADHDYILLLTGLSLGVPIGALLAYFLSKLIQAGRTKID